MSDILVPGVVTRNAITQQSGIFSIILAHLGNLNAIGYDGGCRVRTEDVGGGVDYILEIWNPVTHYQEDGTTTTFLIEKEIRVSVSVAIPTS